MSAPIIAPTPPAAGSAQPIGTEVGTLAGTGGDLDGAPVEALAPRAIADRYVAQGRLGAGGMGVVERVYDRVLERPVALKTLRWQRVGDAPAHRRFEVEATMTAGLQHPIIVPVHDRGVGLDGRPWYTMKLIEGRTLRQALAEGLPQRRAVDVLQRVAEAVAYAHRAGVVHRDIKP
ncbi:MAG: serine/threonine protein kinase, partial [Myxococcales bacterium]|nr:serine/threonine protein kinase [Myxococcales bacterium]